MCDAGFGMDITCRKGEAPVELIRLDNPAIGDGRDIGKRPMRANGPYACPGGQRIANNLL